MVYTVYIKPVSTSRKILSAARGLLDGGGAEAVTMRRVAAATGITAMAVYRHFADRAALLNALAEEGFAELAGRLDAVRQGGSFERRAKKVVEAQLDHALENPRLFELMFLETRPGARRYPGDFKAGRSPTASFGVGLIEEGIRAGFFRRADAWEIAFGIGALLQGLVMLYLGGRIALTAEEFRRLCWRSIRRHIHGIRA